MYRIGKYDVDDRMCDLVCDNYPVLLVMSRFGISLGFGDATIGEVCRAAGVDAATFLAVVNMLTAGEAMPADDPSGLSVEALLGYLHNSHGYFLDFRLTAIRRKLIEAIDCSSDVALVVIRFFDAYVAEVQKHMAYEEGRVFPYVRALLTGTRPDDYSIDVFSRHHDQVESKLSELKRILIRYYPAQGTNELNSVLFDLFTCEQTSPRTTPSRTGSSPRPSAASSRKGVRNEQGAEICRRRALGHHPLRAAGAAARDAGRQPRHP